AHDGIRPAASRRGLSRAQVPIPNRPLGGPRGESGKATTQLEENFAGRQDIRTINAEAAQTKKFIQASQVLRRRRRWAMGVTVTYGETMGFLAQVGALTVLVVAGNRVLAGALSIGSALALRMLTTTATQPLGMVGPWYSQMIE